MINENDSSLFYLKRGLLSAEAIGNIAECAYYHIGVSDHYLYRHDTQQYAEMGVCLLSFLSFRVKEIGAILGFKENTVSKYSAYIRSKTGIEEVGDVLKSYVGAVKADEAAGQEEKN